MNNQNDMRKTRSKQYMIKALLSLMQTKDLEKITINDITKNAQVSRSTFYAQFEDKYDFVDQIIEETMIMLRKEILPTQNNKNEPEQESHAYYQKHFEFIFKNRYLFQTMLGKHGTPVFRQKFEECARITYRQILLELYNNRQLQIPMDYFIEYIISAHVGLTIQWIQNDFKDSPAFMAQLVTELTFHGLMHGLGLDHKVILPR